MQLADWLMCWKEAQSFSSTPTDNPLRKASLPLLEQCSHLRQSDPHLSVGRGWTERETERERESVI